MPFSGEAQSNALPLRDSLGSSKYFPQILNASTKWTCQPSPHDSDTRVHGPQCCFLCAIIQRRVMVAPRFQILDK